MALIELTDSEVKRVKQLLEVFSEIDNIGSQEKPIYRVTCNSPVIINAKKEFGIYSVKQIIIDGRLTMLNNIGHVSSAIRQKISNSPKFIKAILMVNPNMKELRQNWLKQFRLSLIKLINGDSKDNGQ